MSRLLKMYADRWALVTGASSGIGAEFARQLAARGMHLVLAARREEPLQMLAQELHQQHGTRCEVIPCDLSLAESAAQLMQEITRRGVSIELLVNNAGFGVVGDVDSTNIARIQELVRLNIGTLTDLTYRVLPGMLARGQGAIINLSSVAAFQPVAYMGPYAASKAYVLHFSESLATEVASRGVTVLALCPGVTQTSFFDVAGVPGWLKKHASQTSEEVVRTGLRALDLGRFVVVSGWRNKLITLFVRMFPRSVVAKESKRFFRPQRRE